MIYKNLTELIGNTPLLELTNYCKNAQNSRVIAKLEYFNPLGSVKDRVGFAMIKDAESRGLLTADTTIIEPTSGNTGIGLAFTAAAKGYRLILTMPETMSIERRSLLKALGAEIVLTEGSKGMTAAIEKAKELAEQIPNSYIPGQFDNPANPEIHRQTTAVEILRDCPEVDIFVAGAGTGGTITGVGEVLKAYNPDIKIIAVSPNEFPHKIQGIGPGFVPSVMNTAVIDETVQVTVEQAYETARKLVKTEGLLVGISSGAAAFAAAQIAGRDENKGKTTVVILPDSGERYLSTDLFE
jgi:cysteine synthase A